MVVRPTAVVVDDHASFRRYARRLLVAAGYEVVAEADAARSVVALAQQWHPALVLLDVVLPDGDGIDLANQLSGIAGTRVLLTSSRSRLDFGTALGDHPFVNKADITIDGLAGLISSG